MRFHSWCRPSCWIQSHRSDLISSGDSSHLHQDAACFQPWCELTATRVGRASNNNKRCHIHYTSASTDLCSNAFQLRDLPAVCDWFRGVSSNTNQVSSLPLFSVDSHVHACLAKRLNLWLFTNKYMVGGLVMSVLKKEIQSHKYFRSHGYMLTMSQSALRNKK